MSTTARTPASEPTPLAEALARYDRAALAPRLERAAEQRFLVLERFPREAWPSLPLEQYALGVEGSEETFCNLLERRTPDLGSIRGGTAHKLLVFKRKSGDWYFKPDYGTVEAAWEKVREAFVQAFEYADNDDWEAIDSLSPLHGGPALRLKALHVYFPEAVLPVYSHEHLAHFLRLLAGPGALDRSLTAVRLNRRLLRAARSVPGFSGWNTSEIAWFLYDWADPRRSPDARPVADAAVPAPLARVPRPEPRAPSDPLLLEIAEALERKKQVVLHGPPGTGKTYAARRFAVWWLLARLGYPDPARALEDAKYFAQAERTLSTVQVTRKVWWAVANPKEWTWDRLFVDGSASYRYGRVRRNFALAQPGDLVIGYQSAPSKRIVALARVTKALGTHEGSEPTIVLAPVAPVRNGPSYDDLAVNPTLAAAEPLRLRNQGALFSLTPDEAEHALALIAERDPSVEEFVEHAAGVGPLTRLTFHPSYSYEDFVEGLRPAPSAAGTLNLKLEDGVFKRVCREARQQPGKPFLVVIDEINRAHIAKVFGELVTLLEADKRELSVTLPQSKERFAIPSNVYLLGTMNTADRSIKLLDAAVRRRFAFVELAPDPGLLGPGRVGPLGLAAFLGGLNERLARAYGRERRIGHSFLMRDGAPVATLAEFAGAFRQEILPLLEEYCYDDYGTLAGLLGGAFVDAEAQEIDRAMLGDAERLAAALAEEFPG
jgi:hypothetical protein